eukprot:CCRYP_020011-RB/>CCRYP_020011-RB protein AED:0.05 eAED:0.05 QI:2780/1/1/1/1/0.5/4/1502/210
MVKSSKVHNKPKAASPVRTPVKAKASPVKRTPCKSRARFRGSVSKRGDPEDDIEYPETHRIVNGTYEGFQGTPTSEGSNKFILVKNKRGRLVRRALEVELSDNEIQELDHFDAIELTEEGGGGDEDKGLIEYEKGTWKCSKCDSSNPNDSGFCSNKVNGVRCGGTAICETKTWGDCLDKYKDLWNCPSCTLPNPKSKNICLVCNTSRVVA